MADIELNTVLEERIDLSSELSIFKFRTLFSRSEFKPGQYAELAFPNYVVNGKVLRRSYSIASAPNENHIELFIVKVDGGAFTPKLFELKIGEMLWCNPLLKGKFTMDEIPIGADIILVSTGTGLAPFISMLKTYKTDRKWNKLLLIHGARVKSDLGYSEYLSQLEQENHWFGYLPALTREEWEGACGRIPVFFKSGLIETRLGAQIGPNTHIMLCGNPAMIDEVTELMFEKGLKPHKKKEPGQIHVERYW